MTRATPLPPTAREAILAWFDGARRDLPFRATRDPYAILVSEAMAQQTQAARAGEAWSGFVATWPTPTALAAAAPADVLRAWKGLGYNRRALSLWRAARRIVEVHGGEVPADLGALQALPGVGPYTARAIAVLAFGMPVGAVDTNVRRVLGRIVAGDATALRPTEIQDVADAAIPHDRPEAWTHALMDLGATICRARNPQCGQCPARAWCRYQAIGGEPAAGQVRQPVTRRPTTRQTATGPRPGAKAPAFPATSRWLRGRIIDRLRDVQGDGWSRIEGPIGTHDQAAVAAAIKRLEREGLVEVDGTPTGRTDGLAFAPRIRLPTS